MSATGTLIAKAVATVASDKRSRTATATIVCSVVMLFFLPLIAFMGIMSNMENVTLDTAYAQQVVEQSMTEETKDELEHLEYVMNGITTEFNNRDMKSQTQKAQALYVCALYNIEQTDSDFIVKLADCYQNTSNDAELRNAIFSVFGIQIDETEFNNLMTVIKNTVLSVGLEVPDSKTNTDLVKWAEYAYENQWGYVYGSHGQVLTEQRLETLKSVFGSHVTDKEEFIRTNWIGRRTADCVGLIKGYGWFNAETGTIEYNKNGMADVTANGMYRAATEKGNLDTMPDIPGLAVWHDGHIGVYVGDGYVIHAANTYDGVIKTPITSSGWTHWLKIPYINYISESEEINL